MINIIDGWKIENIDGQMVYSVTDEQKEKTHQKNYNVAGIPVPLQKTVEQLEDTMVKDVKTGNKASVKDVISFLIDPLNEEDLQGNVFYLQGECGSGKSQVASTILVEWVRQKRFGCYMDLTQVKKEFTSFKDEGIQQKYRKRIQKYLNPKVGLLIVDDFGAELSLNNNLVSMLTEEYNGFFRKWKERGGIIIVTSNFSMEDAKKKYEDERLFSALFPEQMTEIYTFMPRNFRNEQKTPATSKLKGIFGGK